MSLNTTPKKLRRKPPPLMVSEVVDTDSNTYSAPLSAVSNNFSINTIGTGPSTYYDQQTPFRSPGINDYKYTQNIGRSPRTLKGPQALFDPSINEEEIVSMGTPKPMGPKELPEYYDDSMTHQFDDDDTPPYPISDPVEELISQTNSLSPFETRSRNNDILNQSLTTPTKIPSLYNHTSLSPELLSGRPPLINRSNSPSPTRNHTFNGRNVPTNSFPRSQTLSIPRNPSPERPGRGASSRSPSPKKVYGRSPSLMYDFEMPETYEDNDYEVDNTYYGEEHVSYEMYDDEDYYDDGNESPTSKLFDFSMLPDLPSSSATGTSPTKRMTLHSAISFIKGPNYVEEVNRNATIRKNDALPPVPLDLPKLPFASSSLVSSHFSMCENVWSLSKIFQWCLKLRTWLHDLFILKKEFKKALIKLLVYHKRDVPLETLGPNVDQIIATFLKIGAITFNYGTSPDEDGVKPLPVPEENKTGASRSNPGVELHDDVEVTGVLVDLTSCYCYEKDHQSDKLTINGVKLHCASSRCYINRVLDYEIKFRQTDISEIVLGEDWASHWKLTADDLKRFDKNMAKRQSLLFDLLRYEQTFIQRAKVFVEIVGPEFIKTVKILIGSSDVISVNKFDDDILEPGRELLKIHQKSLFEPLLKILISNGKFIKDVVDIGNIYYNWSQVVKPSLLRYIGTMPMIEELMKIQSIKRWVDTNVRDLPKVKELKVNGSLLFISTFNSRYQQLPLQLNDIKSSFEDNDSETLALIKAIEGIKKTATKVNEMKHHADNIHSLRRIQKQLVWGKNIPQININFKSENRHIFHRGDVNRKSDLKISSSANHIVLLDNYLLITERVKSSKNHLVSYRIIELPIPIEFLLVEVKERETPTIELNNLTRNLTSSSPTNSPKHESNEDPSVYPFKIRYAGRGKNNSFTFFSRSERDRDIWIESLTKARSNLCLRLSKNEPYGVRLISNTCFAYEEANRINKLPIISPHDLVEPMIKESLNVLNNLGYSGVDIYNFNNASNHVAYSTVLSSASFFFNNTKFTFIGTATGVYCTDMNNEWKRIILVNDTTKISVLPTMNLALMLNGGNLKYFPLDVLIKYYYGKKDLISSVSITNEAISFFEIGIHREIHMLFFAKKKGNSGSTNFKVYIPETDNDGIFSCFKLVKKFYVQAECFGISIFNSSFAVHTSKGIEILELDKLLPRSIPELPFTDKKIDGYTRRSDDNSNDIENIRRLIYSSGSKPLGMFKLNNNSEFILVYNECAIFINKHGKLSRFKILKFDYKAKYINFMNNHLFVVCDEVIEIWSISDFVKGTNRLIQVIIGKDIKMLNDNLTLSMANPLIPGLQLIVSLYNKSV